MMMPCVLVGIDLVEIARFDRWISYSDARLRRVLSTEEIAWCRTEPLRAAERFAARFAVREAFFKAIAPCARDMQAPFLAVCASVAIDRSMAHPRLMVNWAALQQWYAVHDAWSTSVSITHHRTTAAAVVVLYGGDYS